jgi:ribosome-associated translation inhibitor RaiA
VSTVIFYLAVPCELLKNTPQAMDPSSSSSSSSSSRSSSRVEIIIPSGKVSTIQIADNNAIAYLTFSESMNIDIESNSVDLFITNSNALTIQGKLNNLELMINASSTTFNDLSFNYMTAEIKGSTSGSIQGNWADLLIEGTLESLYAALNMLEVTINGEGCENINFEGNRKTCKRTNTTVTVPLTICTEPTFMVTHSCNGYYYYHHGSWDD